MVIGMAGKTGCAQSHISRFLFPDLRLGDKPGFMAVGAGPFPVGSLQFITGQGMVKCIGIEMDHLEIPSVVVAVAFNAFISTDFC
jgi:hypothetical protein